MYGFSQARSMSFQLFESGIFVQVLAGNIIFRHFTGVDFPLVVILSLFYPRYYVGLESVSFLQQLLDTLRISTLAP